jgi:hypothetical protein
MAKMASEDNAALPTPESLEADAPATDVVPATKESSCKGCDFKDNYCQNCAKFIG